MPFYRGGLESSGGIADEPDYLWYNGTIVNNTQYDENNGVAFLDPQVRFNETRDKALLRNVADYHFSIVRFSMNGANLDLPLFCPSVELTPISYSLQKATPWDYTVSYTPGTIVSYGGSNYTCVVASTNNPPPTTPYWNVLSTLPSYPQWALGTVYVVGNTVLYSDGLVYMCATGNTASSGNAPSEGSSNTYWTYIPPNGSVFNLDNGSVDTVYSFTLSYQQIWNVTAGTVTISVTSPQVYLQWFPQINNSIVAPPPQPGPIYSQDLANRWWWALDYSYVVNQFNTTLVSAWIQLYNKFVTAWTNATDDALPYASFTDWCNGVGLMPQLIYNENGQSGNRELSLYADSSCWGQRLTTFTNETTVGTPTVSPYCRMFMNSNTYGLMNGFSVLYWNTLTVPVPITAQNVPGTPTWRAPSLTNVDGATYEILFNNKNYTNVNDYRLAPYSGTPPLGFVPSGTAVYPGGGTINYQKVYWVITQDFSCVDTMWSPIANLVFTSQLIPVVKEAQSDPTNVGSGDIGQSGVVSPSAFQPIITDLELDIGGLGADIYRNFVQYQPTAEYRLADIAGSGELRNIDIQLWWRGRLDGQLYPVNMFNLSTVTIKILFRRKGAADKYNHI